MVDRPKKKLSWKAWAGIAAGVIVLGSIGNAMNGGDSPSAAKPETTTTASAEPTVIKESAPAIEPAAEVVDPEAEAKAAAAKKVADAKAAEEKKAADKASKANEKKRVADAANTWWFEENGSFLTGYIKTLTKFNDAAIAEDLAGMVSACSDMQEQTTFLGDRSINKVARPTEFGDEVSSVFDSADVAFRGAAKGCKAVFDKGELTRAEKTGLDAAMAQYAFQSVKDSIYGKYVEMK